MFSYHGGQLWLDWINTQYLHQEQVHDQLHKWQDLIEWLQGAGITLHDPDDFANQEATLTDLLPLRTDLRNFADELINTSAIPATWVTWLNAQLATIPGTWTVTQDQTGTCHAAFQPQGDVAIRIRWHLLHSVMDFLTHHSITRLKRCGNHQCIQYYYDTSKNNARRWCRMETCGNREKARRHYRKKTATGAEGE